MIIYKYTMKRKLHSNLGIDSMLNCDNKLHVRKRKKKSDASDKGYFEEFTIIMSKINNILWK